MENAQNGERKMRLVIMLIGLLLVGLLIIGAAGILFLVYRGGPAKNAKVVAYAEFMEQLKRGDFREISVRDDGGGRCELSGVEKVTPPSKSPPRVVTYVPNVVADGPWWAALNKLANEGGARLEYVPR